MTYQRNSSLSTMINAQPDEKPRKTHDNHFSFGTMAAQVRSPHIGQVTSPFFYSIEEAKARRCRDYGLLRGFVV
jgi:hypothetical protein